VAPLHPASDARIIATDGNRFEDTVDAVVSAVLDTEARRTGGPPPMTGSDRR
jgi:cytidylate kinase